MKHDPAQGAAYSNPVLKDQFPDPFILHHAGYFFAYATGMAGDGLAVPMAHSLDLVTWEMLGGSLSPIEANPPFYWAPEVTYWNGTFYMYYSCGNETFMEIRVATASVPEGPFTDSGARLTQEQFAIDPHVFIDQDGSRYLFYATDFLEHSHIGTGTVVDRMRNWFELEQKPVPVTRAAYDWQVYDPNRAEKGGVRWHTVEGPAVIRSKNRYIQMFSGGNWQNDSYGVAYAHSDSIYPERSEWGQEIDGANSLPILRTVAGKVLGPGHNSIVTGPNGRELYCVYHSWIDGKRMMSLDRMGVVGTRVFVSGPNFDPQPLPFRPALEKRDVTLGNREDSSPVGIPLRWSYALFQLWFRGLSATATLQLILRSDDGEIRFALGKDELSVSDSDAVRAIDMPPDFDLKAVHNLTIEIAGGLVRCSIGALSGVIDARVAGSIITLDVESTGEVQVPWMAATYGFQDTFEDERSQDGWNIAGDASVELHDQMLVITPASEIVEVSKGPHFDDFELILNARSRSGSIAFVFRDSEGNERLRVAFGSHHENASELVVGNSGRGDRSTHDVTFRELRQVRILRIGTWLTVESEGEHLSSSEVDTTSWGFAVAAADGQVELDMVRWTSLTASPPKEGVSP